MKRIAVPALLALSCSLSALSQSCPLGLSGTFKIGPTGKYLTLQAALDDLGAKGLAGPVILELQSGYTSTGETFPVTLTADSCAGATRTVTIRPEAGATALNITGNNVTTILDLDHGSWYIVDGRPGGTDTVAAHALIIANTNTAGGAVQLINGATHNKLDHLNLKAVTTSGGSGVVFFGGTNTTTGNSYNRVDSCNIGPGATDPVFGVFGIDYHSNKGDTINGCNIFNIVGNNWSTGYGICFMAGYDSLTITNNSIYQTPDLNTPADLSVTVDYTAIAIGSSFDGGHLISGNFIGGTAPGTGGSPMMLPRCNQYSGIKCYSMSGAAMASMVSNNTISNITWPRSTGNINLIQLGDIASSATFNGSCIGNNLGSSAAVTLNVTNATYNFSNSVTFVGIAFSGNAVPDQVVIRNNHISGIWADANTGGEFFGIQLWPNGYYHGSYLVKDNYIGDSVEQYNIWWKGNGWVEGIFVSEGQQGPDSLVITGNQIANLYSGSNLSYSSVNTVTGIDYAAASVGPRHLDSNLVHHLYNITEGSSSDVTGINVRINDASSPLSKSNFSVSGNSIYSCGIGTFTGAPQDCAATGIAINSNLTTKDLHFTVSHNRIQGLYLSDQHAASDNTAQTITGITMNTTTAGISTVDNNMIQLGLRSGSGSTSAPLTNAYAIAGISDVSGNNQYIHNTVYLHDDETGYVAYGACFSTGHTDTTTAVMVMNNIFAGARSVSGKGYNLLGIPSYARNVQSDYNILNPSGGYIGGTDSTLAQWQAATSFDRHSKLADPLLIHPEGNWNTFDLHVQPGTPAESAGTGTYTTTFDFDGRTRAALTPVDIGAHAGNFNGTPTPPPPNDTTRHDSTNTTPPTSPTDTASLVRAMGNPFSSTLTLDIDAPAPGTAEIRVYNFSGSLLLTAQVAVRTSDNTVQLPLSQFPDGTYIVRVDLSGKHETIQVLKKG